MTVRRVVLRGLLPRIGFRDNQADRMLIEALKTAFALPATIYI
jgi:hypothetical protein